MKQIKKIAVLTSGGDAPGMNAAIRAVVRTAAFHDIEVVGIKRGYKGAIEKDFVILKPRDVGNIIQRGVTVLFTARSQEFKTPEGQEIAAKNLKDEGIDALVVLGGDGSMHGAAALERHNIKAVGIPATIDNDIWGTEISLGVDTCLNTIISAVDKLRDTALSHERIFVIEVMGNSSGYLAIEAAISAGAEWVIIPEVQGSFSDISARIKRGYNKGKKSHIIIVSEGAAKANNVAENIIKETGMEVRITVLGHVQRGGSPTVSDRNLGTRLGYEAVNALVNGNNGVMVGLWKSEIKYTALQEVKTYTQVDMKMYKAIQNILSK